MKVVIVSLRGPTNLERRGGAQDYIRFIFREWVRLGDEVVIICANESFEGGQLPDQEMVDGISVRRFGSKKDRNQRILGALREEIGSADLLVENIMGYPLLLPMRKMIRGSKIPMMAIKHHFEGFNFFRNQGFLRGLAGIVLTQLLQPIVYRSVQMVGVSDTTVSKLSPWWAKPRHPVSKVSPGIDIDFEAIEITRSSSPLILYFGALDTCRKRVDHLIEAFIPVGKKFPEARLVIGGDGADRAKLEAMAAGSNITFTGFLTEEEKKKLLESAWMFASPSSSEGFGITWVEANAYGLPVIVYDLGLDTVNGSCAEIVKKNDVPALTRAMIALIDDPARRKEMGSNGVANAKRFSWRGSSMEFLNVARKTAGWPAVQA